MQTIEDRVILSSVYQNTLSLWAKNAFIPAIPAIYASLLGTGHELLKLALPIMLFGIVISQLLNGYFSEKYNPIHSLTKIFIPIYLTGILICIFTKQPVEFLIGIFLQGAAGTFYISSFVMLKNYVHEKRIGKTISLISMVSTFLIPIGAIITGYFTHYLSWRYCFVFLGVSSIITGISVFRIVTNKNKKIIYIKETVKQYKNLITDKRYLYAILPSCFLNAGQYVFFTLAPFILISDFHMTARDFGYSMVFPIYGLALGSAIAAILSKFMSYQKMNMFGIIISFIGAALLIVFSDFIHITIYEILLAICIYMIGVNIVSSAAKIGAVSAFTGFVYAASSLFAALLNLSSSVYGFVAGRYFSNHLGKFILFLVILSWIIQWGLKRKIKAKGEFL